MDTIRPGAHIVACYSRILATAVVFLVCTTAVSSCSPLGQTEPAPFPLVHARKLLLTDQAFPPNWQIDPCGSACDRTERAKLSTRSFGRLYIAGSVIQDVYAFSTTSEAHERFAYYREVHFRPLKPPNKTFEPPPEITYHSALADEFALGCGRDTVLACEAFLRYRNYLVEFYFNLDDGAGNGLHMRDIEPILRDMDAQVASTFGITLPVQTPTTLP